MGWNLGFEAIPVGARDLFSGILQQPHSTGYLLAAVFTFPCEGSAPGSWEILS
ncbi:hypothetical protein BDM02DRAFT_3114928 [Thelephora ganbajun]|uniref:Uncharacterized protein n=1 Tax=Thelephora ganbajun TaxID=370292 RepID=A0ACB6ZG15_THEGA|nr:hypothetical protein BDM02DRAFT_3114928 [Thelephora ganbajun]